MPTSCSIFSTVASFSKFIFKFSVLCEPLYLLKRKRVKFVWSDAAQTSFERLKQTLISSPVLFIPITVYTLNCFLIGVQWAQKQSKLTQLDRLHMHHVHWILLRETIEQRKECLFVVYTVHKFRCNFNEIPIKVIMDHSTLTKLISGKGLS